MVGRVTSTKTLNTATVVVESHKTHPVYGKSFVRSKKYLVDDRMSVKVGDIVEFEKIAPISKRKHWRITKVVGRDIVAIETEIMKEAAQEAIEKVMPVEAGTETVEATAETAEVEKKPAKKAKAETDASRAKRTKKESK